MFLTDQLALPQPCKSNKVTCTFHVHISKLEGGGYQGGFTFKATEQIRASPLSTLFPFL